MKKLLYPTCLAILLFSCSQPSQTEKDLRETINKEVSLEIFDLVRRENTFLTLEDLKQRYDYLSVVYLQNGCQPCYPKCNYSGLICNADSSRRRGFITSTESSYRNIKKKILTLACFQESFSSLQSFQQQSVV